MPKRRKTIGDSPRAQSQRDVVTNRTTWLYAPKTKDVDPKKARLDMIEAAVFRRKRASAAPRPPKGND